MQCVSASRSGRPVEKVMARILFQTQNIDPGDTSAVLTLGSKQAVLCRNAFHRSPSSLVPRNRERADQEQGNSSVNKIT